MSFQKYKPAIYNLYLKEKLKNRIMFLIALSVLFNNKIFPHAKFKEKSKWAGPSGPTRYEACHDT